MNSINKESRSNPIITCVNKACQKCYHFTCTNLSSDDKKALSKVNSNLSWFGGECKRQSSRHSTSPKPSISQYSLSDVVNLLIELKQASEFCSNKIDDFAKKA